MVAELLKRGLKMIVAGLIAAQVLYALYLHLREDDQRQFERVSLEGLRYKEVGFTTPAEGIELAGMLFLPDGAGEYPAAVIIHGSGTSRRDNGWYLTLAKYLQDNGVVVLLPDKRGSEGSGGDWRSASFEDLATDTMAAVRFLMSQGAVAADRIGIIGMSQGGQIAPLVAAGNANIAWVVNVVGGAIPMHDQLLYEESHNLMEMGVLPGLAHVLAYPSTWSIIHLRQKSFWNAVGNFDATTYWNRVEVPALVLYGEEDTNVPSARSATAIRALDKPNIDVRVYPGSGHALESPEGQGDSIIRHDALDDIRAFIQEAAR